MSRRRARALVLASVVLVTTGISQLGATAVEQASPTGQARAAAPTPVAPTALVVSGDVRTPLSLSAADLKAMPRIKVETKDDTQTVVYEGVLVGEILKRAGVPVGADLRGNAVASYVMASATDGYKVVFSLAELDNGFTGNDVIIADTVDGKPLFAYQGPWRIVAPKDKRGARSIRMLQRLEVVRLQK